MSDGRAGEKEMGKSSGKSTGREKKVDMREFPVGDGINEIRILAKE